MRLDGQRKTVAVTAHKKKPDGTTEITHRVEKHPVADMMRKARVRSDDRPGTREKLKKLKPLKYADGTTPKRAKRSAAKAGDNMMNTISALRRARQNMLQEAGAFAGDGRLERPAPGFTGDYMYPFQGAAAGNAQYDAMMQPLEEDEFNPYRVA